MGLRASLAVVLLSAAVCLAAVSPQSVTSVASDGSARQASSEWPGVAIPEDSQYFSRS
jgi:hypothetical protein